MGLAAFPRSFAYLRGIFFSGILLPNSPEYSPPYW